MRIVDITQESLKRREKLGKIEKLVKKFFSDCDISSFEDYISINSPSGKDIVFINLLIGSGSILVKDKKYEDKAIAFAKEYEEKILKKSSKTIFSGTYGKEFLLEKDYSRNK